MKSLNYPFIAKCYKEHGIIKRHDIQKDIIKIEILHIKLSIKKKSPNYQFIAKFYKDHKIIRKQDIQQDVVKIEILPIKLQHFKK